MKRRPLPNNKLARMVRGFLYPFEALRFIGRHELWGLAAISIAINVALFVGLLVFVWVTAAPIVVWIDEGLSGWSDRFEMQSIVVFASLVVWVFWLLLAVLALGASSIALLLVGQAVASPFLDMLSERVERIVLLTPEQPFTTGAVVRSVLLSVSDLFWGVVVLAAVNIPVFLVSLTAIGAIPASIASFVFSCLLLAVEFIGLSMARHSMSYRERWASVWGNTGLSLGFGACSMLLLLVPGLNLILLPLAAVGGTLAYCDLRSARP